MKTTIDETLELASPGTNVFSFRQSNPDHEVLRISPEGFFIEGRKLPGTPESDAEFYAAFKSWMDRSMLAPPADNRELLAARAELQLARAELQKTKLENYRLAQYIQVQAEPGIVDSRGNKAHR